jgi:hypothetical protein
MHYYVGFEVLRAVTMKSTIVWDVTACSLVKVKGEALLSACFMLVFFLAYLSTMKMKAICSF